jgi:nicotinamide riboside kinase
MSDDLSKEFESYRRTLPSEEDKQSFDRKIKRLLEEHGVDYVRGYVDALKEAILK